MPSIDRSSKAATIVVLGLIALFLTGSHSLAADPCAPKGMTLVEDGPKKFRCSLIVPLRYSLFCAQTALVGYQTESQSASICSAGVSPTKKQPKTCATCGEAYSKQLDSALKNSALAVTPKIDRNIQSAIVEANAAYASCWNQVQSASNEDCSATCGGRLFARVVRQSTHQMGGCGEK